MSTEEDRIWDAEQDRRIEDQEREAGSPLTPWFVADDTDYTSRRSTEPGTIEKLNIFLDHVEQMDLGPLGHLTCHEVTALADLMAYQRGEDKGAWVIIHHLVDSEDEEPEELEHHLREWPSLEEKLRRAVSEDTPCIELLNEVRP